jgi:myo-inositol-1(or 4)-monophosphatase
MLKLDVNYLGELLAEVGREALMKRFQQVGSREKADGSLVTEADLVSQQTIGAGLAQRWPQAGFLAEEMTAAEQQQALADQTRALWVLDPLDGTTNYAAGMPFFAISLALLEHGRVRFGMVHDPVRAECFWAEAGQGAWLNGRPLLLHNNRPAQLRDCVAIIDYKRLANPLAFALVSQAPFRSQRSLGSVALEWCWLAAGRGSLYLHGAQSLWDYAAGRLIFQQAGGALPADGLTQPSLGKREAHAAGNAALLQQWSAYLQQATSNP